MAGEIRAQTDFLTLLRRIAQSPHGEALLHALSSEIQHRRRHRAGKPRPWTLEQAVQALSEPGASINLFGALRLLRCVQPSKSAPGYSIRAEDDAVRIDQTLYLGFAPNEVDVVDIGRLPMGSSESAGGSRTRLEQSAVGLLGPTGVLPFHWTELAYTLASHPEPGAERDLSFHAWINVIQRRQLGLLYRAWSDAQAVVATDRPDDAHPISDRLRALAGLALPGLRERGAVKDAFKTVFSAALTRRVRSPGGLAAMLSCYFDTSVSIEEFVPHWLDIPDDQATMLGAQFAALGQNAVLGARVLDVSVRFRVLIGPLSLKDYHRFLPTGDKHAELRDLVTLHAGPEHEWDVVPVLRKEAVPPCKVVEQEVRLGWTAWLMGRDADIDADDLVLTMTPQLRADASRPRDELAAETVD